MIGGDDDVVLDESCLLLLPFCMKDERPPRDCDDFSMITIDDNMILYCSFEESLWMRIMAVINQKTLEQRVSRMIMM